MSDTVINFYRFAGAVESVPLWPLAVFIGLQIIAMVKWREYRMMRDGTWHSTGAEMRRLVDGKWEYRPMTESESNDWKDRTAW